MNLDKVSAGSKVPEEVNVIIEIPANSNPIKYEHDKETGAMFVDRLMSTAMYYPCNYGYVPNTLSDDGDAVDVLVVTPFPLISGAVITCRPIGVLEMEDESGMDAKVLAVPIDKLSKIYKDVAKPSDLGEHLLSQISHFFDNYKGLEPEKWVKLGDWSGKEAAYKEIETSVDRYNKAK